MFQKNIWDELWEKSGKVADWDDSAQIVYDALCKEVVDLKGKKILEAGSGTGRISLRIASEGADVTLVDFSEIAIEQAKQRFKNLGIQANFIVSDIMDMSMIPDNTYDVVWNGGVLEHFTLEQQLLTLKEMKRVLKPNGLLITLNPNANCPTYQVGKWFMEKTGKWSYGRELPIFSLEEVCEKVNLNFIKEYSVGFKESLYFFSQIPNALHTKLAFEKWYDSMPKEKQEQVEGYLLVTVCKKDSLELDIPTTKPDYISLREMEDKETIIILSSVHFRKDLWQRPQQLAVQFHKKGHRVIYVNYRVSAFNVNNPHNQDTRNSVYDMLFLQGQEDEGVIVLDKLEYLTDKEGNEYSVRDEYLTKLISFFGGKKTKIITYFAQVADLLETVKNNNPNIEVYFDCVDDITGFNGKRILPFEEKLIKISDGVIVTSKTLYVHKSRLNEKCVLIPNAVNPEEFVNDFSKPNDLKKLKGPIIGYVGAIANWFDQDLVCSLAEKHSNWNFVLIGTIYTNVDKLKKYKNIYLLGRKEYNEVPAFMKHFDVGIIPFIMNDLIINTNPIKFFEYLAAGIKTVATPMPELINEPYCYLGENAEEISQKLTEALRDTYIENTEDYLIENSWSKRADEILSFISDDRQNVSNRDTNIKEILSGYEKFINMPLISLLSAEIYHDLGETDKAVQLINDNLEKIIKFSPSIQIRLGMEWEEVDYLFALIQTHNGIKGLKDALTWHAKGIEFLKVHVYRILGNYERAIALGEKLVSKDKDVLEELANVYFELEKLTEANQIYKAILKKKGKLITLAGAMNYSQVAIEKGNEELAAKISEPFKQYLSELATEFLELFKIGELEQCINVGKEFLENGVAEEDVTADIYAILALCYEKFNELKLAKEYANHALQLNPLHKEAFDLILRIR